MKNKYSGVWPTMITAFDNEKNLDIEANTSITKYLIEKGSNGLFAVCQSSEMFFLNLEEKVALAKCIVEAADGRVPVIASGHTSDELEDQIKELDAISKTGVDAVVLVSNRLVQQGEDSSVFLQNLKAILDAIPNVKFGIYECPYPYRRLLTNEELKWCVDSGRIIFLKDVSCDIQVQKQRVEIVQSSDLKLFNANTETLLDSLIAGYDGYNGVMGNFHIDIYKWLFENYEKDLANARVLQNELTIASEIEKLAYPINAKYHMTKENIYMTIASRKLPSDVFSEDKRLEVDKLIAWEKEVRSKLNI